MRWVAGVLVAAVAYFLAAGAPELPDPAGTGIHVTNTLGNR